MVLRAYINFITSKYKYMVCNSKVNIVPIINKKYVGFAAVEWS